MGSVIGIASTASFRISATKLAILIVVVVAATAVAIPFYLSGGGPDDVRRWLQRNAIPLQTVEAGHGFQDMEPLNKVLGNAQVVAIGEATHGTREFFQFKHRMLEFLASRGKFDVVALAMEADWPTGLRINDYVLHGEGDPATLLDGLSYWVWKTEEVLDMIKWMRAHNADPAHTTKLKFYGVDGPAREQTIEQIDAYLRHVDPEYESGLPERLKWQLRNAISWNAYSALEPQQRTLVSAAISELEEGFRNHRDAYISRSSERDWMLNRHHVTVLRQTEESFRTYEPGKVTPRRERDMAENTHWIEQYEGPNTQILVWAHNGHVSRSVGNHGLPAMGSHLRELFGPRLVVFGFAFGQGSFRAVSLESRQLSDFTVGPALNGSLDAVLSSVGLPMFVTDLRALPRFSRVSRWLATPRAMRSFGASFTCAGEDRLMGRFKHQAIASSHYDALVFIARTSAARPTTDSPSAGERDCTAANRASDSVGGATTPQGD